MRSAEHDRLCSDTTGSPGAPSIAELENKSSLIYICSGVLECRDF